MSAAPIRRISLLLFLLLLLVLPGKATHIVGAELTYSCIDGPNGVYAVTLRLLRDCLDGEAPFDDIIYLHAFPTFNSQAYRTYPVNVPTNTPEIIPEEWAICTGQPYGLCIEEAVYETIITLPPVPGGYELAWARCCRNNNIDNLFNPLNQGVTFLAHIPGPEDANCNNMPVYNNRLPIFICAGEEFLFDHSATDVDGDSLVYSLSRPFTGLNVFGLGAGNPAFGGPQPVVDGTNPMGPPPYGFVTYNGATFNAQNPFGPGSASIDSQTGLLRFAPPNPGVFVVAVSVMEYRNGLLLSENKLDLQIHAIPCLPQNSPPAITHTFQPGDSVVGDTLYITTLDSVCYNVIVTDPDSGIMAVQAISQVFNEPDAPTLTVSGTNPLLVQVCWPGPCRYAGSLVELILMGYDQNNCPIYNPAFDTVWIRVLPSPPTPPQAWHELPPGNPTGPDTLVVQIGQNACFVAGVADTLDGGEILTFKGHLFTLGGIAIPHTLNNDINNSDSTGYEVCFTPSCDLIGQSLMFVTIATLWDVCPPDNEDRDTLFILVQPPPNPPPVVTAFPGTAPISQGDTIFVDVHDQTCFRFSVNDTAPGVALTQAVTITAMGGAGAAPSPAINVISTQDSLLVEVCWTPYCANEGGLYRFILSGSQVNACGQAAGDEDTVWIRVRPLIDAPPILSHSFLPGYALSGDTLLVVADSLACFAFTLRDTGQNTYLDVSASIALAGGSTTGHAITLDIQTRTDTLLEGTACFTPGCDYLDLLLLVRLTGRDTFDCEISNIVHDSLYIRVVAPPNQPPVIRHDLSGLPTSGNTVSVVPQAEPFCYTAILEDPDGPAAALTAEGVGLIFDEYFRHGNPGTVQISGSNPLLVSVCWAPSCHDSGQSFALVVCGRDTSRCALLPEVCDTVRFEVGPCSISLPNVFTPNGDGIGDDFLPFDDAGVEFFRLNIFDRWGQEVFAGENLAWDGTMKGQGKKVPEGIYYYIFEYRLFSARGWPLKDRSVGYLTLIR